MTVIIILISYHSIKPLHSLFIKLCIFTIFYLIFCNLYILIFRFCCLFLRSCSCYQFVFFIFIFYCFNFFFNFFYQELFSLNFLSSFFTFQSVLYLYFPSFSLYFQNRVHSLDNNNKSNNHFRDPEPRENICLHIFSGLLFLTCLHFQILEINLQKGDFCERHLASGWWVNVLTKRLLTRFPFINLLTSGIDLLNLALIAISGH